MGITRRTSPWAAGMVLALAGLATLGLAAQQPQRVERVDVARVIVDVRVIDDTGRAVVGLDAADFDVRIDGQQVRVESAQWIGGAVPGSGRIPSTEVAGILEPGVRGRLVVFVVQKSMQRERLIGLLRILQESERLLTWLTPDDRVAVLSFDYHLKIWLDFTGDLDRVRTVLEEEVMFRKPAPIEPGPGLSLVSRLSQQVGRATYTIEDALRLLGHALEPLPGSKSVVPDRIRVRGVYRHARHGRGGAGQALRSGARGAPRCAGRGVLSGRPPTLTITRSKSVCRRCPSRPVGSSHARTSLRDALSIGWPMHSSGTTSCSWNHPTSNRAPTASGSSWYERREPCSHGAAMWTERPGTRSAWWTPGSCASGVHQASRPKMPPVWTKSGRGPNRSGSHKSTRKALPVYTGSRMSPLALATDAMPASSSAVERP